MIILYPDQTNVIFVSEVRMPMYFFKLAFQRSRHFELHAYLYIIRSQKFDVWPATYKYGTCSWQ